MSAEVQLISPAALGEICKQRPVRLIDVRTPAEFEQLHAKGATNVPLEQIDANVLSGADDTVYVICRAGSRGQKACEKLLALNPQARVANVDGGTLAWTAAGLPIERVRKRMSFERKARMVSVLIILVSFLLSIFVHRGLLGIAGLVAAGLVFASMTNLFGMGLVLGKAPWYRGKAMKEANMANPQA